MRTLRLDQGSAGLGRGLRRRHRKRRHRQWPEAATPARVVGAQARGSDCCARLVAVQCYSRARAAMGAKARARARRLVTGGRVLERLGATKAPGTDAGHEQGRLGLVAHGNGGSGGGGGGGGGGGAWWKCD